MNLLINKRYAERYLLVGSTPRVNVESVTLRKINAIILNSILISVFRVRHVLISDNEHEF